MVFSSLNEIATNPYSFHEKSTDHPIREKSRSLLLDFSISFIIFFTV